MLPDVLDRLLSDDLLANACAFSTAPPLRQFFARRAEVREVGEALRRGSVGEEAVRDFLARLLGDLTAGVLFRHDLTVAALAVALEELRTPFADEFLRELADLRLAEVPLAPRVAQEVLAHRQTLPQPAAHQSAAP